MDKAKSRIIYHLPKLPKNSRPIAFTCEKVKDVIKKANSSKSIDPDGINLLILKRLGSMGVKYVIKVLNI